MLEDLCGWLREQNDRDRVRLMATVSDADLATAGGKLVVRLAMDQVSTLQTHAKIVDIVAKAADTDDDAGELAQVVKWLAYAQSAKPGYLETWAPDGVDLVAMMDDFTED